MTLRVCPPKGISPNNPLRHAQSRDLAQPPPHQPKTQQFFEAANLCEHSGIFPSAFPSRIPLHPHSTEPPRVCRRLQQFGSAHLWTPVTNAHLLCRLRLDTTPSHTYQLLSRHTHIIYS